MSEPRGHCAANPWVVVRLIPVTVTAATGAADTAMIGKADPLRGRAA